MSGSGVLVSGSPLERYLSELAVEEGSAPPQSTDISLLSRQPHSSDVPKSARVYSFAESVQAYAVQLLPWCGLGLCSWVLGARGVLLTTAFAGVCSAVASYKYREICGRAEFVRSEFREAKKSFTTQLKCIRDCALISSGYKFNSNSVLLGAMPPLTRLEAQHIRLRALSECRMSLFEALLRWRNALGDDYVVRDEDLASTTPPTTAQLSAGIESVAHGVEVCYEHLNMLNDTVLHFWMHPLHIVAVFTELDRKWKSLERLCLQREPWSDPSSSIIQSWWRDRQFQGRLKNGRVRQDVDRAVGLLHRTECNARQLVGRLALIIERTVERRETDWEAAFEDARQSLQDLVRSAAILEKVEQSVFAEYAGLSVDELFDVVDDGEAGVTTAGDSDVEGADGNESRDSSEAFTTDTGFVVAYETEGAGASADCTAKKPVVQEAFNVVYQSRAAAKEADIEMKRSAADERSLRSMLAEASAAAAAASSLRRFRRVDEDSVDGSDLISEHTVGVPEPPSTLTTGNGGRRSSRSEHLDELRRTLQERPRRQEVYREM